MLILCWINAVYDMTQVASFIFYLGVLIIIFTLCVYLFIVMSTITSQASHRVSSTSSSSSHQFSFMATFLYKVLFITCFSVYKASSFFFYLVFWIKAWPLSWFFLFSLIVMKKILWQCSWETRKRCFWFYRYIYHTTMYCILFASGQTNYLHKSYLCNHWKQSPDCLSPLTHEEGHLIPFRSLQIY